MLRVIYLMKSSTAKIQKQSCRGTAGTQLGKIFLGISNKLHKLLLFVFIRILIIPIQEQVWTELMPATGLMRKTRTFLRHYGFSNIWTVRSSYCKAKRYGTQSRKARSLRPRTENQVIISDSVCLVLMCTMLSIEIFLASPFDTCPVKRFFTSLQLSGRKLLFVSFSLAQWTLRSFRHIFLYVAFSIIKCLCV